MMDFLTQIKLINIKASLKTTLTSWEQFQIRISTIVRVLKLQKLIYAQTQVKHVYNKRRLAA